jgi:hypothetical protein
MAYLRPFVLVTSACFFGCAFAALPLTDEDLRMAGECSAIGSAIMKNASAFPEQWRQAGLLLMLSPMYYSSDLSVPFKENAIYRQAATSIEAQWLSDPVAESFARVSVSRVNACIGWIGRIPKEVHREMPEEKR